MDYTDPLHRNIHNIVQSSIVTLMREGMGLDGITNHYIVDEIINEVTKRAIAKHQR